MHGHNIALVQKKQPETHTHTKTQNKTSNPNYICSDKKAKQPKLYLLRALLVGILSPVNHKGLHQG